MARGLVAGGSFVGGLGGGLAGGVGLAGDLVWGLHLLFLLLHLLCLGGLLLLLLGLLLFLCFPSDVQGCKGYLQLLLHLRGLLRELGGWVWGGWGPQC